MRFSSFFQTIILLFFIGFQCFAQNEFDVENPSQEDISLYAKPQKGEALALIPNGETLTSLEAVKMGNTNWHKVKYGEYTGYVNANYLKESTGTPKAIVTYQQANITKLVLIHAVTQYAGYCYLLTIDNTNMKIKVKNRFKCKFGVAGISKQKEGDKKTPLGHYCVTSESTISNQTEEEDTYNKYGGYNIHLNYPNVHDAAAKRTGSGICLHGGYSRMTEGCVRILDEGQEISTKNILTVGNFVTKGTHVLITNTVPEAFKQKANTELPADCYTFIQTACGKVCNHSEWTNLVAVFAPSITALPTPTPTTSTSTAPTFYPTTNISVPPTLTPTTPTTTRPANASTGTEGYSAGYIKSSTGFANLRQKPNKDSAMIERIPNNQAISYKATGSWFEVISQKGNKGYIHSSLIGK